MEYEQSQDRHKKPREPSAIGKVVLLAWRTMMPLDRDWSKVGHGKREGIELLSRPVEQAASIALRSEADEERLERFIKLKERRGKGRSQSTFVITDERHANHERGGLFYEKTLRDMGVTTIKASSEPRSRSTVGRKTGRA